MYQPMVNTEALDLDKQWNTLYMPKPTTTKGGFSLWAVGAIAAVVGVAYLLKK